MRCRVEELFMLKGLIVTTLALAAACPPGHAFDPGFLRLGVECASLLGEAEVLEALLAAPVRPAKPGDVEAALSQAGLDVRPRACGKYHVLELGGEASAIAAHVAARCLTMRDQDLMLSIQPRPSKVRLRTIAVAWFRTNARPVCDRWPPYETGM